MKTVSTDSPSAGELELETPNSMDEAMETGFLPDDPHYRLTGEFKKETPAEKDAAPPAEKIENENESENDDASAASSSKAAPSESAQTQREEKTVQPKENRWQKRERELRELKAEIARLKTQQPRIETRSETAQPSQAASETTAGKSASKPKLDDVDAAGKPKFKNFAEYEDAKDAWLRQETIREFNESSAKTAQLTQQQQAEREIGQSLIKKFEAPRAKYADFDKVALSDALTIPKGSVAEMFLLDSDHAGEVLYHLGKHPEILQGFYRDHDPKTGKFQSLITPQRQFRKLMEIEAQLTGTAASGENGDGRRESSSAKPVTQASRPAHQVDGKGTVAKDAVEQALEDDDFETFQRAGNSRDPRLQEVLKKRK